jgi:hypothetical protein
VNDRRKRWDKKRRDAGWKRTQLYLSPDEQRMATYLQERWGYSRKDVLTHALRQMYGVAMADDTTRPSSTEQRR